MPVLLAMFISIVIWGLIFWLAYWILGELGLPEPFNKGARIILVLASVIVLICILTGSIPPFAFLSLRS